MIQVNFHLLPIFWSRICIYIYVLIVDALQFFKLFLENLREKTFIKSVLEILSEFIFLFVSAILYFDFGHFEQIEITIATFNIFSTTR